MPELRAYQRKALDQLYAWFELNHEGNPCIVLPPEAAKVMSSQSCAMKRCRHGMVPEFSCSRM